MASYVDHVVGQIQHNVSFLVANGHMSQQDADLVLSHLPSEASQSPAQSLPQVTRGVTRPPPASSRLPQARAIWGYNEDGQDPNDLSFKAGDVIEIVAETNDDWWTGKHKGKQGLFPTNHVEKLSAPSFAAAPATPVRAVLSPPPQYDQSAAAPREKPAYRAFGAAHHGADKPPPPGSTAVNSVGLQEADGQHNKKSKFGKYGNTMAHSAAGGIGFGSAIGGGLVRAIF
ncbi:hypothetical protein EW145_g925 [Phellinidium pouzarii]|uniref:SH3 domain-containing protein n=1 Tax=Phellinidium pouzarii TaxID=167371 RepID=A0A4S4LIA2_9AGAM|nr:hypothetical protein EW145_g925 [Phellinidium pouzarii]